MSLRSLIVFVVVVWSLALPAHAQWLRIDVTSDADSGPGSLRWAIEQATGTMNSILLDPSLAGRVVQLQSPLPPITRPALVHLDLTLEGSLVQGDGIRLEEGTIGYVHTRNFKSGAGMVLGRVWGHDLTSTDNLVGLRLISPGAELDLSEIRHNEVGIVVDSTATDVEIGEALRGGGITTPPMGGGLLIESNGVGVEWNGEGALMGNVIRGNGIGVVVNGKSRHETNSFHENVGAGVVVFGEALNLHIDLFRSNGGLAIDLEGDGLDPIDPLDADTGAHGRLNRPVLDVVEKSCLPDMSYCALVARGRLDAEPNTPYSIALPASVACDPSGYGGESATLSDLTLMATGSVVTDASGHAQFTASGIIPAGKVRALSALTLDHQRRSSEFSNCIYTPVSTAAGGSNDLGISITGPSEAVAGETLTYEVAVTSAGPATAFFRIRSTKNQAPPSVSLVQSVAPGQTLMWGWTDTAVLPGPLSPGVGYSWTILPEGGSDPDMTNNTASILTMIKEPPPPRRRAVRRGSTEQ